MSQDAYFQTRFAPDPKREVLWRTLYRYHFSPLISATDCVLELGAGYGVFINQVAAKRRIAVDSWPGFVNHLDPTIEEPRRRRDRPVVSRASVGEFRVREQPVRAHRPAGICLRPVPAQTSARNQWNAEYPATELLLLLPRVLRRLYPPDGLHPYEPLRFPRGSRLRRGRVPAAVPAVDDEVAPACVAGPHPPVPCRRRGDRSASKCCFAPGPSRA